MGCQIEGWRRICIGAASPQGGGSRWGEVLLKNSVFYLLTCCVIRVLLQVDVKKTALALAITDSELSDEEASILESGGFSVSRATTPQLTDVSEGMRSPLPFQSSCSLLWLLAVLSGCHPHKRFFFWELIL